MEDESATRVPDRLTLRRLERMREVAKFRQFGLRLVLENLEKGRNISAITRTADSVGVQFLHVVHQGLQPILLNERASAGAHRWVTLIQHPDIVHCLTELKEQGFRIYCTYVDPSARLFDEVSYSGRVAIVLGTESSGVSLQALTLADERIVIPQLGFSNSLNVSVAAAVILYEALRQRKQAGLVPDPEMTPSLQEQLINQWLEREKSLLARSQKFVQWGDDED
ncbi:MAG: RNA methyltransferase [Armatimonadetes bacterium]|nr:RNA methyltransferase [Armatimonadota bacterium]MDW8122052.1 RNA methyltransferase [Armatimonadota bacterium]